MSRVSCSLAFVLVVAVVAGAVTTLGQPRDAAARRDDRGGAVPGQYIVTLDPGVDPDQKSHSATRGKGHVRHIFRRTLNGFAAQLTDDQVAALRADPDVRSIVQDYYVHASSDTVPTGLTRTEAHLNASTQIGSHAATVDAGIAIIDSGVDLDHPDLNVVDSVNCASDGTSADDLNGHGTHVAGTAAARDNGSGVVGVAPGARIYAVRVLDADGEGEFSNVICGVEWVTAHADEIDVANLSLGGEAPEGDCNDGSLHQAICESINAGITYVVAAGNGGADAVGDDAALSAPANYDEVITVSAIVDTDGKPGSLGFWHFFWGFDDTLASFSNYGADVDIAAPGVSILSTWPGGGTNYLDGTSMASPHVAGAAAVYRALNPGASPAAVQTEILSAAWPQNSAEGFSGDTDGHAEPLLNAGDIGGPSVEPPPPPPPGCTVDPTSGPVNTRATLSCVGFAPSEWVRIYWDTTSGSYRALFIANSAGTGATTVTIPAAPNGAHAFIAVGGTSGLEVSLPFTITAKVTVSPDPGKAGAYASASVSGFGAGEVVSLRWVGTSTTMLNAATTSATGSAWISFTTPETPRGSYTIEAVGSTTGATASVPFTVIPSLTASPSYARVGSSVTITMRGYLAGEDITVNWHNGASATPLATATAGATGNATAKIVVPPSAKGSYAVEGSGSEGTLASATVTVSPQMKPSATTGEVGSAVTVTMTGFGAGEAIDVHWFDTSTTSSPLGSALADANGSAAFTFYVPDAVAGSHKVQAISATSGPYIYASYYVKASVALSPESGPSGTSVTATVSGYRANETVTIRWYTTSWSYVSLTSAPVSSTGSGGITFDVPANQTLGIHKVVVLGTSSYQQPSKTFTVTDS
jgi:subtilisin family serine protease